MNEKLKKFFEGVKTFFFIIGIIATAGGLFIFGRYFNRRGIQSSNDGTGELKNGIGELRRTNKRIGTGLRKLRDNIHDAKSGLGTAIEVLKRAKER